MDIRLFGCNVFGASLGLRIVLQKRFSMLILLFYGLTWLVGFYRVQSDLDYNDIDLTT